MGAFLFPAMSISYWERATWLEAIDYLIVGSGIVGLTAALSLRERDPKAKIVILEKGILPSGASTKNAGFACFGSVSEILDDLGSHTEQEVIALIRKRYLGLKQLQKFLSPKELGIEWNGGYELFPTEDEETYTRCLENLHYIDALAKEAISSNNSVFLLKNDPFSFKNIQKKLIFNQFEGQLNTGLLMKNLIQLAYSKGIQLLNSVKVTSILEENGRPILHTDCLGEIYPKQVLVATNGFAQELLKEQVLPARAQVLITKPIEDLHLKGTFHLDKGYYYFRNVDNRILFGGGRNLDKVGETTTDMITTQRIQNRLEELMATVILPGKKIEIEQRWSGIMGVGDQKKPIVKSLTPNIHCGVRLGGMGVAIGSLIGEELSQLCLAQA